jgi:hypothetical protein
MNVEVKCRRQWSGRFRLSHMNFEFIYFYLAYDKLFGKRCNAGCARKEDVGRLLSYPIDLPKMVRLSPRQSLSPVQTAWVARLRSLNIKSVTFINILLLLPVMLRIVHSFLIAFTLLIPFVRSSTMFYLVAVNPNSPANLLVRASTVAPILVLMPNPSCLASHSLRSPRRLFCHTHRLCPSWCILFCQQRGEHPLFVYSLPQSKWRTVSGWRDDRSKSIRCKRMRTLRTLCFYLLLERQVPDRLSIHFAAKRGSWARIPIGTRWRCRFLRLRTYVRSK